MTDDLFIKARNEFFLILEKQPNLIKEAPPGSSCGEQLAETLFAFTKRYVELKRTQGN